MQFSIMIGDGAALYSLRLRYEEGNRDNDYYNIFIPFNYISDTDLF